jgi:hypothetical protein
MFEIDYLKVLQDAGIKEQLFKSLKANSKLTDAQIERIYHDRVIYHGQKMDKFINSYMSQYVDLKQKNNPEIDQQLDAMVNDFINKNKTGKVE